MNPEELQILYAAVLLGLSMAIIAAFAWRTKP